MAKERLTREQAENEGFGIQAIAEETANRKGLPEPKARHYEEISRQIDRIRVQSEEVAEKILEVAREDDKLKKKMGIERWAVYVTVLTEIVPECVERLQEELEKIDGEEMGSVKDGEGAFLEKFQSFVDDAYEQLRLNSSIQNAFNGHEELLDEVLKVHKKRMEAMGRDSLQNIFRK